MIIDKKAKKVSITDVTLREYGQNVPTRYLHVFTPEIRVEIASRLIRSGFTNIEILSCIHPKVARAMHKTALRRIATALGRIDAVNLITLVPNRAGYETFLALNLGPSGYNHTMGVFFSAVEAHNLANLGRSIGETVAEYRTVLREAIHNRIRVIGYISAAFGYKDPETEEIIKPDLESINSYLDLYFDLGAETVTLSDLQGVADERGTGTTLEAILDKRKGRDISKLGYHPHHVHGKMAIANSKIAYDLGIRRFDASLGGTGGCITGAPGNQPTEGLVHFFHGLGIETGINEKEVFSLTKKVQKELYSKILLRKMLSSPRRAIVF